MFAHLRRKSLSLKSIYVFGDHRPLSIDHTEFVDIDLGFGEALGLLRAGALGLWLFGSGT